MSEDSYWFAPKRFGTGPGRPISWQGWVLTLAFVAIMAGLCLTFRSRPAQLIPALIPPIVIFTVIGCRTTRGGCRWRRGEEE
jgi:hypothetical protein